MIEKSPPPIKWREIPGIIRKDELNGHSTFVFHNPMSGFAIPVREGDVWYSARLKVPQELLDELKRQGKP